MSRYNRYKPKVKKDVFILNETMAAGADVSIYSGDAPFGFRILDAWSVAKSADAGTWKLYDGSSDITDAVAVTGTDKTVDRVGTIDDAKHEISAEGTLTIVGDHTLADAEIYILCLRLT